ncbi:Uncharacterized protein HZ326_17199 [Fusarium oxysporum f. sp. albedinis]|nr:Uncharacterized protein HZ326_17199 [Fusarium oxysporum f. sp. albedinis]
MEHRQEISHRKIFKDTITSNIKHHDCHCFQHEHGLVPLLGITSRNKGPSVGHPVRRCLSSSERDYPNTEYLINLFKDRIFTTTITS